MGRFFRGALIGLAALCFVLAFAPVSFAQQVLTVASPPITVVETPWWQGIVDMALPLVGAALVALLTWLGTIFQTQTGIAIEEKYRNFLHEAIMNGVRAALSAIGWKPGDPVDKTRVNQLTSDYVAKTIPDTLKHFNLNPFGETMMDLISTKLPMVNPLTAPVSQPRPNVELH